MVVTVLVVCCLSVYGTLKMGNSCHFIFNSSRYAAFVDYQENKERRGIAKQTWL